MSATQAAAMWTDASISTRAAKTILRHLRITFGIQFQVPFPQIQSMSNIPKLVKPIFGNKPILKDGKSETVNYWTMDVCDLIEKEFERKIILQVKESFNKRGRRKKLTFGYPSRFVPTGETTVHVVLGSDHGTGACRVLGKVNYLSSKERWVAGNIEHGSQIIQFGNIKCKKETPDVLKLIAPEVNKMIERLQSGMLVGIRHTITDDIHTVFLPKKSTNICTVFSNNKVYLKWNHDDNEFKKS